MRIQWPTCSCKKGCTGHRTPKGVLPYHKGNPIVSVYQNRDGSWSGVTLKGQGLTMTWVDNGTQRII